MRQIVRKAAMGLLSLIEVSIDLLGMSAKQASFTMSEVSELPIIDDVFPMSEDDFMDLLPANQYFH